MKKILSSCTIFLLLQSVFSFSFISLGVNAQTAAAPTEQVVKPALTFGLVDGMPVKLRTTRLLSSADAKTGETIDFEVIQDVKIGDIVVIPSGGVALGTVTRAKRKGRLAKGGKLDITIDSVLLVSGEKVALRAVKGSTGNNYTGVMTGAIVASGLLFFPAAPFFLFMKGKDVKIPKGTEVSAYINGDVSLDRSKFAPVPVETSSSEQSVTTTFSTVSIKSDPDGAEITVDEKFIGNTPSIVQLQPGDHKISIKKEGYVVWERMITGTAGGSVNVGANLERIP